MMIIQLMYNVPSASSIHICSLNIHIDVSTMLDRRGGAEEDNFKACLKKKR